MWMFGLGHSCLEFGPLTCHSSLIIRPTIVTVGRESYFAVKFHLSLDAPIMEGQVAETTK